ncbi:hypothetical protein [Niallia sp. Man26]|uniref:hypothetical protein n=1 Tax=Niallia sp. Man26 TaxID=2912824 RepID=UPI001EDB6371|nr:hypothetical protein [Niallia sp. Man26]UPO91060.1 hypothetical protein L8T27_026230 [Niallia sp. Man26]
MSVPENVVNDTTSMMNSMVISILAALLFSFLPLFIVLIVLIILKLSGVTLKRWIGNIFLFIALGLSFIIFIKFGLPTMQMRFSDSLL